MATARDWATGYLEQARADLRAAKKIQLDEPSVFAMLLQMFFEKYAKAALLRSGALQISEVRKSHCASSQLVKRLRRDRKYLKALGPVAKWDELSSVVDDLEVANPQVARASGLAPVLEYPWETASGSIEWPARHLAIVQKLEIGMLAPRILTFATTLDKQFDSWFP